MNKEDLFVPAFECGKIIGVFAAVEAADSSYINDKKYFDMKGYGYGR